jgi:hypothetical protein
MLAIVLDLKVPVRLCRSVSKISLFVLSFLTFLAQKPWAQSLHPTVDVLTTFDYPVVHYLGTECNGISNNGDIVGFFYSYGNTYIFKQAADGNFSELSRCRRDRTQSPRESTPRA